MHWMPQPRPGAGSTRPEDLILGTRVLGHGSLSSCIFLADLERGLVIVLVRKSAGPRLGEWSPGCFQAIADGVMP